ncbi:MAG: hypothetical protein RBU25_19605, partial [Lentisphaeria bacterium]|nr:hypothetical protein [Lentisphaeria bacterium]
ALQAERLATAEASLAGTVGELARKLRLSEARNNVEDAQDLMEQAGKMLHTPRTDLEVQADMGSAIELLLTLFESNCQGGQCQASAMLSMMAQSLRVGMRLGAGASGGGSRAGGPYGGAGGAVGGGTGSGGGEGRGGNGAVDAVPAEFPAEYRGLLERFFQNVEAE